MSPNKEFSRFAKTYSRCSLIQSRVAKRLVEKISGTYSHIVDIGCGSGAFFNAYKKDFKTFLAIDQSLEMLQIHPSTIGVEKMIGDFNDQRMFDILKNRKFDLIVSSSALQWSQNLDWTLLQIASFKKPVALALFTSGTFKKLHDIAGITSPIRSKDETIKLLKKHFDLKIDVIKYRLYFSDTLSMLRYIKLSGVSGGVQKLSITQTRKILNNYPFSYLQFEVVVAIGK